MIAGDDLDLDTSFDDPVPSHGRFSPEPQGLFIGLEENGGALIRPGIIFPDRIVLPPRER